MPPTTTPKLAPLPIDTQGPGSCLCSNLRQAARALSRVYQEAIQPAGIRGPQFSVLMVISRLPHPTVVLVAKRLTMDRTTLARNLKPLEAAGLIQITPGEDRRERVLALTPAGRQALADAAPRWSEVQGRMVDRLGPERAERLLADLAEVVRLAGEA